MLLTDAQLLNNYGETTVVLDGIRQGAEINVPPRGFKTITLPRDVVDSLKEEWEKRRNHLRKKGVRSFSGFLTMVFYQCMEVGRKKRPAPKKNRLKSVEKVVRVGG